MNADGFCLRVCVFMYAVATRETCACVFMYALATSETCMCESRREIIGYAAWDCEAIRHRYLRSQIYCIRERIQSVNDVFTNSLEDLESFRQRSVQGLPEA